MIQSTGRLHIESQSSVSSLFHVRSSELGIIIISKITDDKKTETFPSNIIDFASVNNLINTG